MHPLILFAKKYPNLPTASHLCRKFRDMFYSGNNLEKKTSFYKFLGLETDGYHIFFKGSVISAFSIKAFIELLNVVTYTKGYKDMK